MNEFELIGRLTAGLASTPQVVVGPGDDCAVVKCPGRTQSLLLKTDAVVEGVHFTRETVPEHIGHKALGRCLSDVAAMAGTPLHALVTLGVPPKLEPSFIEAIYAGLNRLARRFEVAVVGGETVSSPDRLFLSVAVLGEVDSGKCVLRRGAKAGDALFVSGRLGGSILGHHLEFEPRLVEARWLADHFSVHAMIDLSDGLAGDLRHLLNASGVGAELLARAIPISRAARLRAKAQAVATPLIAALSDGEDFELLFAVASLDAVPLLDGWKARFPETPLTCVGKVTAQPGLRLRTREGVQTLTAHGYVHLT